MQLGMNLLDQKKFAEAEPLLCDAVAYGTKKTPNNANTFSVMALLGGALLGQQRYADAEPLLLAGYQGMKQRETFIPKVGRIRLTEALERLVQLYDATGNTAEAEHWRKELIARKATGKEPKK